MSNSSNLAASPGTTSESSVLQFTDIAVEKLKEAAAREGEGFGLRVGVINGGCSGLQYHLAFERGARAGDVVFDVGGVNVFVDAESRPHLEGTVLDYVVSLHGAGFKFLNPNASRTCGCGTSFAT
jgi:iron-sulfur cluster insertion protein